MQAKDVLTRPVVTVPPDATVEDVARLLLAKRISAVPVVDADDRILGIVSEGDLMRRAETGGPRRPSWWLALFLDVEAQAAAYVKMHGRRAADVMTRDVTTITEDDPLDEIAALLEERGIKRVPVVRDGRLVGIVSRANLLQGLAAQRPSPAAASKDDASIRATLLDKIRDEAGLTTEFVNVIVTDGVVDLWGLVETAAEKQALRIAAETTAGVRDVRDHVGVMPPMVRGVMWAE